MDNDELRRVEEDLRLLFEELGLGWALTEVDASANEGITDTQAFESPSEQFRHRSEYAIEPRRGSSKPELTSRPLFVRERIELLIDALRRLFIELPLIQQTTRTILDQGLEGRLPMISRISFVPEVDGPIARRGEVPDDFEGLSERSELIRSLLDRLRFEINQ